MKRRKRTTSTMVPTKGDMIIRDRKAKALSQVELADLAGISPHTLRKMERGLEVRSAQLKDVYCKLNSDEDFHRYIRSDSTEPITSREDYAKRIALQLLGIQAVDEKLFVTVRLELPNDGENLWDKAARTMLAIAEKVGFFDGFTKDDLHAAEGSLLIYLRLTARDAAMLIQKFNLNRLGEFQITEIKTSLYQPFNEFDVYSAYDSEEYISFDPHGNKDDNIPPTIDIDDDYDGNNDYL